MANSTTSTVRVVFNGTATGLIKTVNVVRKALDGASKSADNSARKVALLRASLVKTTAAFGAMGGSIKVVAGAAAAVEQLAGAALLLPAGALAGAAAFGTLKIATSGFGDAMKNLDDPAKFAEAIGKLSPNARAAAVAVRGLKPQLDSLKESVQDGLFDGFAGTIKNLGSRYLPVLKTQLSSIASQMNQMAQYAADTLMKPAVVESVTKALSGTDGLFKNMKTSLGDVLEGFISLAGIGAKYLPRLGTAISNVSAKFKDWISTNPDKITRLIDDSIAGFKDLGAIFRNLVAIAGTVFTGLSDGQGSFLSGLRETTTEVRKFLETTKAQEALKSLGASMSAVSDVMRTVLITALQELTPVVIAIGPAIKTFAELVGKALVRVIRAAAPVLEWFATLLAEHPGLVTGIAVALATLFPILKAIASGFSVLRTAMLAWVLVTGTASASVLGLFRSLHVGQVAVQLLKTAWQGLKVVFGALPFGKGIVLLTALAAALVTAYQTNDYFKQSVDQLFSALGGLFKALQPLFDVFGDSMGTVIPQVIAALTPVIETLVGVLGGVAKALAEVIKFITPFIEFVATLAGGQLQTLIPIILGIVGAVKAWKIAQTLLNAAMRANPLGIVITIIGLLVGALIYAWENSETFRNIVMAVWNGVKTGISAAVDFIKSAIGWFGQLPGLISGWFGSAKDWAVRKLGELVDWVRGIPGRILSALGNLGSLLAGSGRALVDGFLSGIRGAWDRVVGFVRQGMQWLRNLWPFSPAKDGPFSGRGYVTYSGAALTNDFADSLRRGMPQVVGAARGLMSAVNTEFSASPSAPSVSVAAPNTEVVVMIDGQEFRGMVDARINQNSRATRRTVNAGRVAY